MKIPEKDDLISRQDAIDSVGWGDSVTTVIDRIKSLPSADAVKVVRCKDCKHRQTDECPMFFEEQIDIDEGDGYYDTDYIFHDYTRDDGFCSWGERRQNNVDN